MRQHAWLGPFNLLIGDESGVIANITVGEWSSQQRIQPLWSPSKLASGAVFYNLDAEGDLPLDTKVSDYLPFWTKDPADARSKVTIRSLLHFQSGFVVDYTSSAPECWLDPSSTFDACAQEIYEQKFAEDRQGTFDYNEYHLQIAAAVALKATNAASWNELWYQRVGEPSGLPLDDYYRMPSEAHPGPGAGISISSDDYAKFLAAFAMSLNSQERPTQPLKLGEGLNFGRDLVEEARLGEKVPGQDESGGYAFTSWRWENGLVESNGCGGWFPAIMPGPDGFWMQLGRDGGVGFGCIGDKETGAVIGSIVDVVIEKVKLFKSNQAAFQPLELVLDDIRCERDEVTEVFCRCKDLSGDSCLMEQMCQAGALSEGACSFDDSF